MQRCAALVSATNRPHQLYCMCNLVFSFLFFLSLQRLWATIRVFVALWIGAVILVCNYGSWYSDSVCTRTQYMAHTGVNSPQLIEARVELSIGLRGINITLLETECEHPLLSICICMLLVTQCVLHML